MIDEGRTAPTLDTGCQIGVVQVGQIYGTEKEPNPQAGRIYSADGISPTLDAMRGGNRMPKILETITMKGKEILKGGEVAHCLNANDSCKFTGTKQTHTMVRACLTPDRAVKRQNGRRFKENGEESFTLTSQDKHGVLLDDGRIIRIRRLTPKECFRLQGWTDDYFEKAAFVNSDSQLYKQAGNGVTVNVVQAIGELIGK